MITKDECLEYLIKLEDSGIQTNKQIKMLLLSKDPPLEVLQFISKNNGFEATNFYQMLRKKHNKNKSPLYTNLLKDTLDQNDIIITLSSLLTQILLYGKKLLPENQFDFYKHVRAAELTQAINYYFEYEKIDFCLELKKLIRADILVLEYIDGQREVIKNE